MTENYSELLNSEIRACIIPEPEDIDPDTVTLKGRIVKGKDDRRKR